MRLFSIAFSLFLLISLQLFGQQKVLIIGIDGTRQDAFQLANTPNMDSLIATATYSWDALNETPTWSGVGWSGMLTGVWRNKHGVIDNSFSGSNFTQYPHFLKRVEDFDPSLHTASICHWAPINTKIVGNTAVDFISNPSTDSLVGAEAVTILTNADPDVIFLHFDDVDHAGHAHGFSPSVPEYIAAIESVDRHVGYVMAALKGRSGYANEDWLILSSTDHGGNNSGHGGASLEERNIFYFASRAGQSPLQISRNQIISNSNCMPDSMGLRMIGTGDYASVPNDTAFQFGANQDFTLELRLKTSGWTGDPSFLGNKNWGSGVNKGFVISCPFGNTTDWKVNIGDGSNRADVNGGQVNDNLWHHLAASFDRDGNLTLYKDGVEEGATGLASVGNIDNTLSLGIGQDGTLNYGSGMNGLISEVRIWKTVVDSITLATWQCTPLNNTHPDFANLVGYWRMNEGTGTNLSDLGPNSLTANYAGNSADWELINVLDTTYDYSNTPRIVDVAVSALAHMCIPIDPAWGLDGNPVGVSIPNPQISGSNSTCQLQHEFYTIPGNSTKHINWTVANGLILQGQDSSTVKVQWGGVGAGQLVVQQCNASDTLDVTINICNSLLDLQESQNLEVFPNPAHNLVTIRSLENIRLVNLVDLSGKTMRSEWGKGKNMTFNLRGLPQGLYILEVISEQGKVSRKIRLN